MDGGQPLARHVDDLGVQFGKYYLRHARVLEQFFCRTPVTTADDQCALWPAMGDGRQMNHRFVIEELVALGSHETAVDTHGATEQRRFDDLDLLHGRASLCQNTLGTQVKTEVGRELFDGERVLQKGAHARTTRCRCGSAGEKACISSSNKRSALVELSLE